MKDYEDRYQHTEDDPGNWDGDHRCYSNSYNKYCSKQITQGLHLLIEESRSILRLNIFDRLFI